jgi:hypothetical protein
MWFLAGGLVVGSVVAGFKFLTRFFLFISSLNLNNQPTIKDDFIPPSPPRLFLQYEATNSATITLSGSGEPGTTVFVTQNKNSLGDLVVGDEGNFAITNVNLTDGQNVFSAVAVDNAGNKSQAATPEVIYYLHKPPKLEISSPADGQKFTGANNFVEVKGTTDAGARITVNDRVVIVAANGSFSYRLGLVSGDNQVVILATDRAGNQQRQEIIVKFSPS